MEDINEMLKNNNFLILYKFDREKKFKFCKTEEDVRDFISILKNKLKNGFEWFVLETKDL